MMCKGGITIFTLIIGCPRSGTYLLASQLENRLGIAIPIETQICIGLRRLERIASYFKIKIEVNILKNAMGKFWKILYGHAHRYRDKQRIFASSLLTIINDYYPEDGNTPSQILTELYIKFAEYRGMKHSGDKIASYEPVDLSLSLHLLPPDTKIVHIIRDPRDVCVSWCKEWFGPPTLAEAAYLWCKHIKTYRRWGKNNPQRYFEVRYEDLLKNPIGTNELISQYLGIPSKNLPSNNHTSVPSTHAMASEHTHTKLSNNIDASNIDKWRNSMSRKDCLLIECIAGSAIIECGYPMSNLEPTHCQTISMYIRVLYAWLRRYSSLNYWSRLIRDWMLPTLYFYRKIRPISDTRIL